MKKALLVVVFMSSPLCCGCFEDVCFGILADLRVIFAPLFQNQTNHFSKRKNQFIGCYNNDIFSVIGKCVETEDENNAVHKKIRVKKFRSKKVINQQTENFIERRKKITFKCP